MFSPNNNNNNDDHDHDYMEIDDEFDCDSLVSIGSLDTTSTYTNDVKQNVFDEKRNEQESKFGMKNSY